MVRIKLLFPIDSTFLSEVIYEGLLYTISMSGNIFNAKEAQVEDKFLQTLFEELEPESYEVMKIILTGNDTVNTEIFKKYGLSNIKSKKTLSDLFRVLKENSTYLISKDEINLKQSIKGTDVLFDVDSRKEGISLQLLKLDRYTGLTTTELNYTSKQLTSYFSKELILISLIGLYSSYVATITSITSKGPMQTHYFLFFSPDEILNLLSKGDKVFLKKLLVNIKGEAKNVIKETLSYSQSNEIILLELMLNMKIHELMRNENLEKISTVLFKICPEGQTYKVYEVIPLTMFRDTIFNYKVKEYFGDRYEDFIEAVQTFLKDKYVRKALLSLNSKRKSDESDNILYAVQHLYKFVTLGDIQGLYNFLREIWNAHEKTKDKYASNPYLTILKYFPY
ncbi:MAG: hypothetical protein ACP5K8_08015 [Nitrososphaeria archaeon]